MVSKIFGAASPDEFLTGNADFVLIRSLVDFTPSGLVGAKEDVNPGAVYPFVINGVSYANAGEYDAALARQQRFDHIVRALSNRAQPTLLGGVTVTVEDDPIAGFGNNAATALGLVDVDGAAAGTQYNVYNLRVSFEHRGAWGDNDGTTGFLELLLKDLNGRYGLIYDTTGNDSNINAVKADVL